MAPLTGRFAKTGLAFLICVAFQIGSLHPACSEEQNRQDPGKRQTLAADRPDQPSPALQPGNPARIEKKPAPEASPAKAEERNDGEDEEEDAQYLMDEALALVTEAQEYWVKGDIEKSLDLLDRAYGMILEANGKPDIARQKDDLRLLIAKRILMVYNSLQTYAKGPRGEIPMIMNEDVQKEIRLFQTRERDFFIRAYQQSGQYRPYIVKQLKQAGLPEELSWLPLVESGFKIKALSPARALGIWQFIPSTGYKYGLSRDEWIDERMDVEKATRGAIEYLTALHNMFGDWLTVLAGYNCGEGRVLRVISRQRINYLDHFWDLYRQLPNETARYVPRFLATLHIVKDPQKYGMDLGNALEKPQPYETAKSNKAMRLQDIAARIDVPEETLISLNPELRHQVTPDREYDLRLPLEKAEVFVKVMPEIPQWERPKRAVDSSRRLNIRHRVRTGESLASIAQRYGTTVNAIRTANRLSAKQGVRVGQRLVLPVRGHATDAPPQKSAPPAAGAQSYKVKKGDTLQSLAKRFGTTVGEIKASNRLKGSTLKTGQVIRISGTAGEGKEDGLKKKKPAQTRKRAPKKVQQD